MTARHPTVQGPWRRVLLAVIAAVIVGAGLLAAASAATAVPNPSPTPIPAPAPSKVTPTHAPPQPAPPPPTGKPAPSPNPSPTPAPAPGPTPPGGLPTGGDEGGGGWFDITGSIRDAIVGFVEWIAETGLKPVLTTLGATVLSTPDLTQNSAVHTVWITSLVVANSVFVLFIVAGGFVVMSQHTLQARHGLKEILPRIAVAGITTNMSLLLIGKVIVFGNALCTAIAGQGVDGNAAAATIGQALTAAGQVDGGTFLVALLVLGVMVMAVLVIITFILRIAMLVILTALAPLALTCHAVPQSEGIAYLWWRALFACFAIQLGQAVILLATVRVFLTPKGPTVFGMPASSGGLISVLVCLTMLWLLVKLPGWMRTFILGPLASRSGGMIRQLTGAIITIKTLGALTGITRSTSRTVRRTASVATQRAGTSNSRRTPLPPPPAPAPPPSSSSPAGAAGSAAFSHAPTSHRPMPPSAGSGSPVAFSSATTATVVSRRGATTAAFSNSTTPPVSPVPRSRPTVARFSSASPPVVPSLAPRPSTSATPQFSAPPVRQTAPKRLPGPAAPAFSDPPPPRPRRRAPRGGDSR